MTTGAALISLPTTDASRRVVIAEDDANVRELLAQQLRVLGYDVAGMASDGEQAIALARTLSPNAIILDIHMPNGSGIDAATRIATECPECAIVFVSGDQSVTLDDAQAERTHAVAVLCKPVPSGMLDATLRMAVNRSREIAAARREATDARAQLEARKLIERAKGILMRRTGTSEQEAYRIMQRSSQDKSMPMVKIAEAVLASEPGLAPARQPARQMQG